MQQPELTADQWKRRALRAEGAMRHALWMRPIGHIGETADEMATRFRMHIEATYPDLITRDTHQPVEVWKYAEDCGCEDDGSQEYENDHCEEGEDGPLCSRSFLGRVCSHREDGEGDGPEWSPDRVEWPCPPIAELNALTDVSVLRAAMTTDAARGTQES
jgi:hypothetical protein